MSEGRADYDLLEAWGGGDLAAGELLFERYFDALYRFFRNKVQDDCRDLMQQTLLACVEGRARFRRDASFRTYLYQTARYQLYAYYRKRNREAGHDPAITGLPDSASSPSRVLARRQDERLLLEALRRMPIDDQIVLELSFWEDLTGREIAEVLGSPEGTVRGRLSRATERLRREMQSSSPDALQDTADDLPAWALRLRKTFAS